MVNYVCRTQWEGRAMSEQQSWRERAFDVYRHVWNQIELVHELTVADSIVAFYVEELKESLLDLKQSVIAEDERRVLHHLDEIALLMTDLRQHLLEDEDES
jgi:hypothetical protein